MSETFDPLDLLRDYISNNRNIVFNKKGDVGILHFENFENTTIKLSLETPTAWKKQAGNGYYSLGSIWCAVNHRHLKGGE